MSRFCRTTDKQRKVKLAAPQTGNGACMIVRKLRLKRGWSQTQLAEMAGVTSRTIQRLERGQTPSLETAKALASVFEVDLSVFQTEDSTMSDDQALKNDEQEAIVYGKKVKEFYEQLISYFVVTAVFLVVFWGNTFVYTILGSVGIGMIIYGLITFEVIHILSPGFERKIVEKRLGRKL
jgi:transcriptional regulator with XRE-family HTH domain